LYSILFKIKLIVINIKPKTEIFCESSIAEFNGTPVPIFEKERTSFDIFKTLIDKSPSIYIFWKYW